MSCDCFEQWFDLTVAVKHCQGNSFWKQSEFIFKQGKLKRSLLELLSIKKNVGCHRSVNEIIV